MTVLVVKIIKGKGKENSPMKRIKLEELGSLLVRKTRVSKSSSTGGRYRFGKF